jgi:hypothetical protein
MWLLREMLDSCPDEQCQREPEQDNERDGDGAAEALVSLVEPCRPIAERSQVVYDTHLVAIDVVKMSLMLRWTKSKTNGY